MVKAMPTPGMTCSKASGGDDSQPSVSEWTSHPSSVMLGSFVT